MGREDDAREAWRRIVDVFLSNEVHDRFHDATEAIGLPHPGALKLLLLLDADEPLPMRAIAERIRCDASYVTALVDTLEGPGYVERQTSPADRRVKLVRLTPAGEAARETAQETMSVPPAAFGQLDAGEVRMLARLLAKAITPEPATTART